MLVCDPDLAVLWNAEAILLSAWARSRRWRSEAGVYVRWLQWAVLPFYGYIVLRSFISALERPRWALVIVRRRRRLQRLRQLGA